MIYGEVIENKKNVKQYAEFNENVPEKIREAINSCLKIR